MSFLGVRLFCCCFFFGCSVFALSAAPARPACALCSSPCYPRPAAPRPLTRPSPLPFSFSQSTLPVRLPSLTETRCHSSVPPACSTPAPLRRPYPLPWGLSHPSVPSVPVSHLLPFALCPVCGGGVYLRTGLWPCPRTGMAVGFLRTRGHGIFRRNTERTTLRRLSNSLRCICTVEPSRIDQLRQLCTELFHRTRAGVFTKAAHFIAPRRCPMAPSATKAGRMPGRPWSTPQSRARVNPMVPMQHHLAMQGALPPCSKSADCPHTPAVSPQGRQRDVAPQHRTRVHQRCPSQQSLREHVLCTISQDPGTSVSEYWIRLPVRLSFMAEPWQRASPEGHSAAPRHLPLFPLVTTLCSAPAQYPIPILHPVSSSFCP